MRIFLVFTFIGLHSIAITQKPLEYLLGKPVNSQKASPIIFLSGCKKPVKLINLNSKDSLKLSLINEVKSKSQLHRSYRFTFKSKPIINSFFKVNVDQNNCVVSYSKNLADFSASKTNHQNATSWFIHNDTLKSVYLKHLHSKNGPQYRVIIDASTKKIIDKTLVSRSFHNNSLVRVFNPNPIVSANSSYGIVFNDNNDLNSTALENELFYDSIQSMVENNQFLLENQWVKFENLSPPSTLTPSSFTGDFLFSRNEEEFEFINTFYHIEEFNQYLEQINQSYLSNEQIIIDVHANNGEDNSYFTPSDEVGLSTIQFGTGGVDDAEDAHVIIHEYAHFISHRAAPNTNEGNERLALDEALGDYLASAYSKNISTYSYYNIFSWDGHNEFWDGRITNSTKTYDDLNSSFYDNAEIWSSMLMDLNEDIGREILDEILLESLFGYAPNMKFSDAAQLMLKVDSFLFNSLNRPALCNRFLQRKIYNCPSSIPTSLQSLDLIDQSKFLNGSAARLLNRSEEVLNIHLIDAQGKQINSFTSTSTEIRITSNNIASGAYILVVEHTETQKKSYFKLIRQ